MAKLSVIQGQTERPEYPIDGDVILGRAAECDVTLPGPLCSREHARITREDGAYFLEDLGSTNGTLVNGRAVEKAPLRDGDWITIGDYQLTFLLDDDFMPPAEALLLDGSSATIVGTFELEEAVHRVEVADAAVVARYRACLEAVKKVADEIAGALDIGRLVELILHELLTVFPQADGVHVVLLGLGAEDADLCRSACRSGGGGGHGGAISQTLLRLATEDRKAVLASDAASDVRFEGAQSIVGQGLRSIMCCPLVVRSRVLGAIQVDTLSAERPFTADDVQMLVAIAGQMAVAAENAHLHGRMVAQQRLAAVGEAVAGVAHCMKNVINCLAGGSYILDLGLRKQEPEKVAKGWDIVKRNTDFMSDLVRDMLAYCRKAAAKPEPTDVAELLSATLAMASEAAAEKGLSTALSIAEALPQVMLDATAVKRAVLNLLTNAIDACDEGDTVRLSAALEADGNLLRIAVTDTGPGIPDEVLVRLFEPFFTTKGSRGTGLGLALVQKVAEQHGGRAEVSSTPGQGSEFRLYFAAAPGGGDTAVGRRAGTVPDDEQSDLSTRSKA